MASPGPLMLSHAFGLAPVGHNNVVCMDDNQIAFPVGRHISITNAETRASTFLLPDHFDKVQRITALALAPNRKYLACAEVVSEEEPAQVSIFTLSTGKRTRMITPPVEINVFQWRSLAFSADGKVLVGLGDAPDYLLLWWQWDKGKLLGYARVGQPAFRVALSRPADVKQPSTCAVAGPKLIRFFKIGDAKAEGQVKSANASVGKRELLDFTDLCWLDDERLLACASSGEVCVFESQELRQVLHAVHPGSAPLRAIIPCARGFVVAGDRGLLSVHERTEDNAFVPLKVFTCHGAMSRIAGAAPPGGERKPEPITSLALSPSEDVLVCTSGECEVSLFPLKDMDILRADAAEDHFTPLCGGFHQGAVSGLDVCLRKPLLATCSAADRTVRVWEYNERVCVHARLFVEEPLSVAFHPSGYHLLVGFGDKLRFFHLLVDDFKLVAEFHLKSCKEVRFSNGGHLFAAAAGPNVVVFGTYTLEQVGALKGHAGPVRSLSFSTDDFAIVTSGVDGAVYEWAIDGLARVEDHVLKGCQYNAVLCAERGSAMAGALASGLLAPVASGAGAPAGGGGKGSGARAKARIVAGSNDGKLRELHAGQISRELDLGGKVTQLILTPPDRATRQQSLVVALGDGALLAYSWPLDDTPPASIHVHRGQVSRLRLSADGGTIFSCGEDGAVFLFAARQAEARDAVRRAGGERDDGGTGGELDTVLVSHSELTERLSSVKELEKHISDQQLQADFKLHQAHAEFARALKKAQDDATVRADEAAARYEALSRARDRAEREVRERERATEVAHMRAAEELEHLYERKLAAEAARYESLSQQKADLQSAFEERMLQMQQHHVAQLEAYKHEMDAARRDAERMHSDLRDDRERLKQSYEEELTQEDRDYEDEVQRMKRAHTSHLQAERDEALKLKGEAAIVRKKFEASRTDMQKLRNSLDDRNGEIRTLSGQLADADKMVMMLRKDMREREDTIADKERRMAELKSKNKELEKFKYVLDYKLRELKKELEPRDEALNRMRTTVTELDDELQRDFKHNVTLTQEVGDKQAKIDSLSRELKRERRLLAERERFISSFARDLHRLVTYTEPALWRDAIKDIYRTYAKSDSTTDSHSHTDADAAEHEIHRQREYMERAIDTLKGRVSRSEDKRTFDQKRKVGENQTLLHEVNALRVENKDLKGRVHSLNAQLELADQRTKPRVAGAPRMPPAGAGAASISRPRTGSAGGARAPIDHASTESLPAVGDGSTNRLSAATTSMRPSASVGQLARGSALAGSRERSKVAEMLAQLDENNREIGAQRNEIRRLRDQVSSLMSAAPSASSRARTPLPPSQPQP